MDPMFKNTCLESIEKEYMPLGNHNLWQFMEACQEEFIKRYRPHVHSTELFRTTIAHDFGILLPPTIVAMEERSRVYQNINYIRSILNKLEQEHKETEEKLKIIEQLRKYGVEYSPRDYNPITNTFSNTAKAYSLGELRKNLKQAEEAESEVEKILKDKKMMDKLVHWELGGGHGTLPNDVSYYAARLLKPKLKKLVYELRVEEEADRRIEKLIQDKQKQKFEEAVKKRMAELGYES